MKGIFTHILFKKTLAVFLLTAILGTGAPYSVFAAPTVSLTANGQDASLVLTSTSTSFTIDLTTSADATSCDQTSPVASGLATNASISISFGHPDYPADGGSTTFTVNCQDASGDFSTDTVVVSLSLPTLPTTAPTIDLQVNGSNGPVNITTGDPINFTWTSTNATSCDQTSPVASGLTTSGSSSFASTESFYPAVGSSTTLTISCLNTVGSASDSVVVNIVAAGTVTPPPSSGGGGGGGGGRSRSNPTTLPVECPWINSYMRIDFNNDPIEVMKLQSFLKVFMGYDYVTINGVFDQATYDAVGVFQALYSDEILTPWGHTAPTHYVYILTLKKVNEIYCQNISILTADQLAEITAFRIALQASRDANVPVSFTPGAEIPQNGSTTPTELPIVGQAEPQRQNLRALTAAIFSLPDNLKDTLWNLYEFILILIVLYALGVLLKDVFYDDLPVNMRKRFLVKWSTISTGLIVALMMVLILAEYHLVLLLLIALFAAISWAVFILKGKSIRASVKSWYIVGKARVKSFLA